MDPVILCEPPRNCQCCPRLVSFREEARRQHPEWHNAPVPSFGPRDARLLVVGLAPGLRGANRTGRPFTGDWAGDLLFSTLIEHGFAEGTYDERPDDGLVLLDCRITNAVRCVPPQNKPSPEEIKTCRSYLSELILRMPRLEAILALGRIAHESVARAVGLKPSRVPFGHAAQFSIEIGKREAVLFDSYHCSRYNTNTGVLTPEMFRAVFIRLRDHLGGPIPALSAASTSRAFPSGGKTG